MKPAKKKVLFFLNVDVHESLRAFSDREDRSMSKIVEDAIIDKLLRHGIKNPKSLTA